MKLYLIRHGIATDHLSQAVRSDADRPLTAEGREETEAVGNGLLRLGLKPDYILASPLVRARQTAEILAAIFALSKKLEIVEALSPGGETSDLYAALAALKKANEVMLVGHQPDMTRLAQSLLACGEELDMPFKKAGVCRIDIADLPPTAPGILRWFITPRIATLMAGKDH